VRLLESTKLSKLAGTVDAVVNSHHHQAIESLGADLVATAWTTDGVIEAMEDPRPDRFVMAVQWHPELGWEDDVISQRLFKSFVNHAAQQRESELDLIPTPA
jgi:putative glutamine amidotransferase